jgi:thiol-disulfide isomerase/thioredoxin
MPNHKFIINLSICLTLFFGSFAYAQKAPGFELPGDNKTIHLDDLRGKVVYLDFWASWCVPCRKSFPWMNDMQARYGGENFTVIAVNLDSSKAEALKFLKKIPANFDIAYDPEGKVASQYKLKVMPSSYLIDKKGELVLVHKGYRESDANEIEKKINNLINSE